MGYKPYVGVTSVIRRSVRHDRCSAGHKGCHVETGAVAKSSSRWRYEEWNRSSRGEPLWCYAATIIERTASRNATAEGRTWE